jgi:hypothetical protein
MHRNYIIIATQSGKLQCRYHEYIQSVIYINIDSLIHNKLILLNFKNMMSHLPISEPSKGWMQVVLFSSIPVRFKTQDTRRGDSLTVEVTHSGTHAHNCCLT